MAVLMGPGLYRSLETRRTLRANQAVTQLGQGGDLATL